MAWIARIWRLPASIWSLLRDGSLENSVLPVQKHVRLIDVDKCVVPDFIRVAAKRIDENNIEAKIDVSQWRPIEKIQQRQANIIFFERARERFPDSSIRTAREPSVNLERRKAIPADNIWHDQKSCTEGLFARVETQRVANQRAKEREFELSERVHGVPVSKIRVTPKAGVPNVA
jgi:hypothetical protein